MVSLITNLQILLICPNVFLTTTVRVFDYELRNWLNLVVDISICNLCLFEELKISRNLLHRVAHSGLIIDAMGLHESS